MEAIEIIYMLTRGRQILKKKNLLSSFKPKEVCALAGFNCVYDSIADLKEMELKKSEAAMLRETLKILLSHEQEYEVSKLYRLELAKIKNQEENILNINSVVKRLLESKEVLSTSNGKLLLVDLISAYQGTKNKETLEKVLSDGYFDSVCKAYVMKEEDVNIFRLSVNKFIRFIGKPQPIFDYDLETLNALTTIDFESLLTFAAQGKTKDSKRARANLFLTMSKALERVQNYQKKENLEAAFKKAPDSFYDYFSSNEKSKEQASQLFENLVSKGDSALLFLIMKEMKEDFLPEFYPILSQDSFWKMAEKSRTTFLASLTSLSKQETITLDDYKIIKSFVLGTEEEPGFGLQVLNDGIFSQALAFVGDNKDDIAAREIKVAALKHIQPELSQEGCHHAFGWYLGQLEAAETSKQMKARSHYFKDHSLKDFYQAYEKRADKKIMDPLLKAKFKKRKWDEIYNFIKVCPTYPSSTMKKLVEQASRIQDPIDLNFFTQYIKSNSFGGVGGLQNLPGTPVTFVSENSSLCFTIDDSAMMERMMDTSEGIFQLQKKGEKEKVPVYVKKIGVKK